jgi:uncharacterized protein YndB with AHSA1/START domain
MDKIEVPIRQKTLIKASRDRVFRAIATGEGLDEWFTKGSSVDKFEGGDIKFVWRNWGPDNVNAEAGGPVLEYRKPEKFVFQWWATKPSTVEIELEEVEEGTLVKLKEYGYENSKEGIDRCLECATGWGEALTLMKFYLEHGVTY